VDSLSSSTSPALADDIIRQFPVPANNTGIGVDWVPTPQQSPEVIQKLLPKLDALGARWVVFLNDGTNIGANDDLVRALVARGIEPVMRVYTPNGAPITGDLEAMVRHYTSLGVHYFQLFNEPNLRSENQGNPPDPAAYVDQWLEAARAVVRGGGYPGFGALAPDGDVNDLTFLRQALTRLRDLAPPDVLRKTWLAAHPYSFNRPASDPERLGFRRVEQYDQVARSVLGRSLPIIATETGVYVGDHQDPKYPPVSPDAQRATLIQELNTLLTRRPAYVLGANFWMIANGPDHQFDRMALFNPDGSPTEAALAWQQWWADQNQSHAAHALAASDRSGAPPAHPPDR
jgi:hypothetical protein